MKSAHLTHSVTVKISLPDGILLIPSADPQIQITDTLMILDKSSDFE
jgi:hypothetical protein